MSTVEDESRVSSDDDDDDGIGGVFDVFRLYGLSVCVYS